MVAWTALGPGGGGVGSAKRCVGIHVSVLCALQCGAFDGLWESVPRDAPGGGNSSNSQLRSGSGVWVLRGGQPKLFLGIRGEV
jgi:hypothetical protein